MALHYIMNRITAQTRYKKIPSPVNIFSKRPIRGYRKELIFDDYGDCYNISRRVSLNDVFQPNGLIPAPEDLQVPCNRLSQPVFSDQSVFCSGQNDFTDGANALRRLRGRGTKQSNPKKGFYADGREYLEARNKLYTQNTSELISRPTGCPPTIINESNNTFCYTWVNGSYYTVVLPPGQYYATDIDLILVNAQIANGHYMVSISSDSKIPLIRFSQHENTTTFTCAILSEANFSSVHFQRPVNADWLMPPEGIVPQIIISGYNRFCDVIGFQPGTYPSAQIVNSSGQFYQTTPGSPAFTTTQLFSSTREPLMAAQHKKGPPSTFRNPQYGQDNAVNGTDRIFRLKYNVINNTAKTMGPLFGTETVSAMAYNTNSEPPYTLKNRVAHFQCIMKTVPGGEMRKCRKLT